MSVRRIGWFVLPVVVGMIVYARTLWFSFVWDDQAFLGRWIAGGADLKSIFFPDPEVLGGVAYYHPFTSGSGFLLYRLFGHEPFGWHAFSLAMHLLMTAGVFALLRRITAKDEEGTSLRTSAIGAALFACWPTTVESVAWSSARGELLMATFVVWGLVLHLRARDRGESSLPAALLFFSALMSKETGIVFPVLAIASTWLVPRSEGSAHSRFSSGLWLPHVLAFVAYSAMRSAAFRAHGSGESLVHLALEKLDPATFGPAIRAWGFYVREALVLGPGNPYTETPPAFSTVWPYAVLGIGLVAAAVALARKPEGRPWALVAVVFVVVLGPPLAVASAPLSVTAVAMRYLYLPSVAIAIAATLAIRTGTHRFVPAAAALLLVVPAAVTYSRTEPWKTNDSLWARAVRDEPFSTLARVNHAQNLGEGEAAIDQLRIAAYLCRPQSDVQLHMALSALAQNYLAAGRFREASITMKAVERHRGSGLGTASALYIRSALTVLEEAQVGEAGNMLVPREDLKRAAIDLEFAKLLDPYSAPVRIVLATIYEALDEPVRAIQINREIEKLSVANAIGTATARRRIAALQKKIDDETDPYRRAFFEAQTLEFSGKSEDARAAYDRALAISPDRIETLVAVAALEFEAGRHPEAVARMEHASTVAPKDPIVQFNLGVYRMYAGNAVGAVSALQRAIALQPGWQKPYFHLGRALEMNEDFVGAVHAYRQFLVDFEGPRQTIDMVEERIARVEAFLAARDVP